MRTIKHCIKTSLILLFLLVPLLGVAQNSNIGLSPEVTSVIHPSPNAAALGKFTEVPVSLHTGIPEVNIPVWQIQEGDILLHIGLSYHSGGIKVDELASWVGLGWALNAGGMITRSTRGLPDQIGFFDYGSINRYVEGQMSEMEEQQYIMGVFRGYFDSEPDLYYLSVNGLSCKFFIGSNGEFVIAPGEHNLRIQYGIDGYDWIVTDGKGVRYKFKDQERTTSYTYIAGIGGTSDAGYYDGESAWHITEIEDAKGNKVRFNYAFESNEFVVKTSETVNFPTPGLNKDINCQESRGYSYARNSSSVLRLASIVFGKGEIAFLPDHGERQDLPGSKGLAVIEVRHGAEVKKRFRLFKSYMLNSTTGTQGLNFFQEQDKHRLRLDSLREESGAGAEALPSYRFTYNTLDLPYRNSLAQDHWGFYNGENNTTGVSYTINGREFGAKKEPNPYYAKAGILTSVKYPTGGSVEFEYEANRYLNTFGPTKRDTALAFLADNNNDSQVEFYSEEEFEITPAMVGEKPHMEVIAEVTREIDGASTGPATITVNISKADGSDEIGLRDWNQLYLTPGVYKLKGYIATDFPGIPYVYFNARLTGKILLPTGTAEEIGPGLRIASVTKNFADGESEQKRYSYIDPSTGKTSGELGGIPSYQSFKIYHYRDVDGPYAINWACGYDVFSSNSNYPLINTNASYIGYSHVDEFFDSAGAGGKKTFRFTNFSSHNDLNAQPIFPYPPNSPQDWKRGLALSEQVYKAIPAGVGYASVKQQESAKAYGVLPGSLTRSNGIKVGQIIGYAYGGVSDNAIYMGLVKANYNLVSDSYQLLVDTVTVYDQDIPIQTIARHSYTTDTFLPREISTSGSDGSQMVQQVYYTSDYRQNSASSALLAAMLARNMVGVPVESSLLKRSVSGERLLSGVLNEYGFKQEADGRVRFYLHKLHEANPLKADMSSRYDFLHLPSHFEEKTHISKVNSLGQPLSYSRREGAITTLLWGYRDQYPVAEIVNASYTELEAALGGEAAFNAIANSAMPTQAQLEQLHGLRDLLPHAMVTVYTYDPLVGVTSVTDPNGRTIYYEYDGFGRLQAVRDQEGNVVQSHEYHYAGQ